MVVELEYSLNDLFAYEIINVHTYIWMNVLFRGYLCVLVYLLKYRVNEAEDDIPDVVWIFLVASSRSSLRRAKSLDIFSYV